MRRLPLLTLCVAALGLSSCFDSSDTESEYAEWRAANNSWLADQMALTDEDGELFYTTVTPVWDPEAYVLIHYFNDRTQTAGNLSPLLTSTVDVKYIGRLYDDEPFDSSYTLTDNGDSIYRTTAEAVITGWQIALEDMHVGDTCQVIVPYDYGYGALTSGSIVPYSHLVFNMKLVDIPYYERNK